MVNKLTIRDLAPKNLRYDLLSYKLLMIVKKKYINLTFLKIFGILLYFYNLKLVTAIGPFCFIYKMQVVYILQSMHFWPFDCRKLMLICQTVGSVRDY